MDELTRLAGRRAKLTAVDVERVRAIADASEQFTERRLASMILWRTGVHQTWSSHSMVGRLDQLAVDGSQSLSDEERSTLESRLRDWALGQLEDQPAAWMAVAERLAQIAQKSTTDVGFCCDPALREQLLGRLTRLAHVSYETCATGSGKSFTSVLTLERMWRSTSLDEQFAFHLCCLPFDYLAKFEVLAGLLASISYDELRKAFDTLMHEMLTAIRFDSDHRAAAATANCLVALAIRTQNDDDARAELSSFVVTALQSDFDSVRQCASHRWLARLASHRHLESIFVDIRRRIQSALLELMSRPFTVDDIWPLADDHWQDITCLDPKWSWRESETPTSMSYRLIVAWIEVWRIGTRRLGWSAAKLDRDEQKILRAALHREISGAEDLARTTFGWSTDEISAETSHRSDDRVGQSPFSLDRLVDALCSADEGDDRKWALLEARKYANSDGLAIALWERWLRRDWSEAERWNESVMFLLEQDHFSEQLLDNVGRQSLDNAAPFREVARRVADELTLTHLRRPENSELFRSVVGVMERLLDVSGSTGALHAPTFPELAAAMESRSESDRLTVNQLGDLLTNCCRLLATLAQPSECIRQIYRTMTRCRHKKVVDKGGALISELLRSTNPDEALADDIFNEVIDVVCTERAGNLPGPRTLALRLTLVALISRFPAKWRPDDVARRLLEAGTPVALKCCRALVGLSEFDVSREYAHIFRRSLDTMVGRDEEDYAQRSCAALLFGTLTCRLVGGDGQRRRALVWFAERHGAILNHLFDIVTEPTGGARLLPALTVLARLSTGDPSIIGDDALKRRLHTVLRSLARIATGTRSDDGCVRTRRGAIDALVSLTPFAIIRQLGGLAFRDSDGARYMQERLREEHGLLELERKRSIDPEFLTHAPLTRFLQRVATTEEYHANDVVVDCENLLVRRHEINVNAVAYATLILSSRGEHVDGKRLEALQRRITDGDEFFDRARSIVLTAVANDRRPVPRSSEHDEDVCVAPEQ